MGGAGARPDLAHNGYVDCALELLADDVEAVRFH